MQTSGVANRLTSTRGTPASQMSTQPSQHDHSVERAAEALLREHPDALVCGLSRDGLITPLPQSVGLWGQGAIEGRAVIDGVVAADRGKVVGLWQRLDDEVVVNGQVRMLSKPSRWVTLYFLDRQSTHGVIMCVILPSEESAQEEGEEAAELPPAAPRFSTLMEDESAKVLECDDAFTEMFGYTDEELIGKSVLDQIHPDDQGRAVEGWLAVLSTRRNQQTRLRRKRKDGGWVWVDTTLHNFLNQPDRNHVLVELIDVSAEMEAQEALYEREELLRRLTDAMPDGLLQLDTERNVVYHNARLLRILQTSSNTRVEDAGRGEADAGVPDELPPSTSSLLSTLTAEATTAFAGALKRVLGEGVDQDVEVDFRLPSGEARRALMSARALLRPSGEVSGAITSVLDVTDSARAREELEQRATFDALTGCLNRSAILSAIESELDSADQRASALVYIDLDNFKPVNDSLGHAAGDELLVQVAERLKDVSRRDDDVGRLGGDEFVMLLRNTSGPDVAMHVAQRICETLSSPAELSGGTVELRASVGVACANAQPVTVEELVRRADAAMYCSKGQGRGVPVLHDGSRRSAALVGR
jgi:diguanylate cyclase (GGDEF)-like protein/PAS domain S-box-containing protein